MENARRVCLRRQYVFSIAVVLAVGALFGAAEAYDYPIDDPYLATVLGTPKDYRAPLPKKIPHKIRKLKRLQSREVPDVLRPFKTLRYSLVRQKGEAPLIFIIAGTGATHHSQKNMVLMRAFYQAGFHVVGLTSPTHSNFVVAASSTGVPGHLQYDAQDLYRVMQHIWDALKTKIKVREFHLSGYSLGGTQAAFVAQLDEVQRVFNFNKVLMINPSLTLYSSVSKLDRMLENIPGGLDNFNVFFAEVRRRLMDAYKESDRVDIDEEFIYQAFQQDPPSGEALAALIGIAFRLSSTDMIATSDILTNFGFIKPANVTFRLTDSLDHYHKTGLRVGFTDYYHEFFYPYYQARDPSLTRESLSASMSLRSIESYLRAASHVGVVHNRDDVILTTGEIDFFLDVFGSRAKLYPTGGHLGNLQHRDTLAYIVEFFQ